MSKRSMAELLLGALVIVVCAVTFQRLADRLRECHARNGLLVRSLIGVACVRATDPIPSERQP